MLIGLFLTREAEPSAVDAVLAWTKRYKRFPQAIDFNATDHAGLSSGMRRGYLLGVRRICDGPCAKIPEQVSQNSAGLQSSPGTGQQSSVFGDWDGSRSWLSNQGIDLGVSYLSEPAWNVAGGKA